MTREPRNEHRGNLGNERFHVDSRRAGCYVFDEPELLFSFGSRDGSLDPVYTDRRPEGAPTFDGKPAYHTKATLVGEKTAGAGLGSRTGMTDLGHGFEAFVPDMRPVHPHYEGGFEGVGVSPDIKASSADAIAAAHLYALSELIERTNDAARKKDLEAVFAAEALERARDARSRAVQTRAYWAHVGQYDGDREILVDGGSLYYADRARGIKARLRPEDGDTFALEGSPGQLLRFERSASGDVIGLRISEPGGEVWRPANLKL